MFYTTSKIIQQEDELWNVMIELNWPLRVLYTICDYVVDKRGPAMLRDIIVKQLLRSPKKKLLIASARYTNPFYCPGLYEIWMQYSDNHLMQTKIRFISENPDGNNYIKRDSWQESMENIWNFVLGDNDIYFDHFSWVGPSIHQYTPICSDLCKIMANSVAFPWKHMIIAREAAEAGRRRLGIIENREPYMDVFHHKPRRFGKHADKCCKAARVITSEPSYGETQEITIHATFLDTMNPLASWSLAIRNYTILAIEYDNGDRDADEIFILELNIPDHTKNCIWPFICGAPLYSAWDEQLLSVDTRMSLEAIHAAMRNALKETLGPQIRQDVAMFRKSAPHKTAAEYSEDH